MHCHLSPLTLLLSIALGACAGSTPPPAAPDTAEVEVERVLPVNENLTSSALEVLLVLRNPSERAVKVESVHYNLDTGDVAGVIKGEVPGGATVGAAQVVELRFRQSVPFPTDGAQFLAVLERKALPVHLFGDVRFASGGKSTFDKRVEVATPLLPQFVVFDAQAARYEEEGIDVTLFLRLINDNVFPLLMDGVRYDVYVGSKKVHSGQGALGERLLATSAEEFEVSTILDESKSDKAELKSMLANRKVDYRVEGELLFKGLTVPFSHAGEIELASGE